MSLAEYVREVLLGCPVIEASRLDIQIDRVGTSPTEYSIDAEPGQQVVKRYLNGDTVRRFAFALTARFPILTDAIRAENGKVYEALSLWLEECSRRRRLPPMDEGMTAQRMAATGSAYLLEQAKDSDSAIYQMQMELIYYSRV